MKKKQQLKDKGLKYDTGKAKLSMIPVEALEMEAQAFEYGAKKYAKNNFKGGMEWSRLLDASLRHIYAFSAGENIDEESLVNHIGNARACLAMLAYNIKNNKGIDDR